MSECNSIQSAYLTYYQRNREVILNRATDYYENDKKRLREQARNKAREKNKKREYGKNRYHNVWRKEKKAKRISKKLSRGKKKSQYNSE